MFTFLNKLLAFKAYIESKQFPASPLSLSSQKQILFILLVTLVLLGFAFFFPLRFVLLFLPAYFLKICFCHSQLLHIQQSVYTPILHY